MTPKQIHLVKSTWAIVALLNTGIKENLFHSPIPSFRLIPIFQKVKKQPCGIINSDIYISRELRKLDEIIVEIRKLSDQYGEYGSDARHYLVLGNALLQVLSQGRNRQLNRKIKAVWLKQYQALSHAFEAANHMTLTNVA